MKEKILNRIRRVKQGKSFYEGDLFLGKELPTQRDEVTSEQKALSRVIDDLEEKHSIGADVKQGIFYLLAELTINVVEHAQADRASLKVFEVKNDNETSLEFLIKDDGIGIRKSFLENKLFVENDKEALKEALEGVSAKGEKTRGFGLRTSKQIVSKGFRGNFLLSSGKAAFYEDNNQESFLELPSSFSGTIVDSLIFLKGKKFNIYNYIE